MGDHDFVSQQVLTMMKLRKYKHIKQVSATQWACVSPAGHSVKVMILGQPQRKLSLSQSRTIMNHLMGEACVLLLHEVLSHYAAAYFRRFPEVQLMLLTDILINPTEHELYDPHTKHLVPRRLK